MFSRIKHLVTKKAHSLASDPARASRTVLASVLVLGIFSLTLNLGSQIAPALFGAYIEGSGPGSDFVEASMVSHNPLDQQSQDDQIEIKSAADQAVIERAQTCFENRQGDNPAHKQLLERFEESFSGILPGAGNLMLEYSADINDRRDQLVREVLKKYANLKFCVPEESFETIHSQNYTTLLGYLNTLSQVREHEEDPEEYPIDELHGNFIGTLSSEFSFAAKDLVATEQHVTDVIDHAIDFAIKLDQQTGDKVVQLTNQTTNRLIATSNTALKTVGKLGVEGNNISGAFSGMLADLRSIFAIDHTIPKTVGSGGSQEKLDGKPKTEENIGKIEGHDPIYAALDLDSIEQAGLPPVGTDIHDEVERLIKGEGKEVSYGLLNLFKIEKRPTISKYLGKSMTMYVGAKLNLDPLTPGAEEDIAAAADTFAIKINNPPDDQICYPLDPSQEDKDCFEFKVEPSLI